MGFRKFVPFLFLIILFLFSRGILAPILPLYFDSVGLSIIDIGLAFAILGVSLLIFEVLWGFIADRINRDLLMPVIIGVAVVDYLLFPLFRSFAGILVLQVVMGFYLSGTGVVARLRIAELAEPAERGRAFGFLGSTFGLSMVVGSFVDSAIANHVSYADYFYIATVLAIIPFVPFLFLGVGSTKRSRTAPPAEESRLETSLRTNELVLLCLVAVSIFSSWGFFTSLMPVIVTKAPIAATPTEAIITFGVFSASSMIFQPLMGEFGSRRPKLWITLGLGVNAASFILLTFASSILLVYLLTFIAGACYATVSPVSLSQLITKVPGNYLGRVLGFYGGAEDVGIIIGPFVGSVVWQLGSVTLAFISMGLILIGVLLVYLAAVRPSGTKIYHSEIMIKE